MSARRTRALLTLALLAASCAPNARRPAPLDLATLADRYERLRETRAARARATRLDGTLWVEGEAVGRWPAIDVDVALAGPDAIRARMASLFGTALDLTVRDDTLRAWVPPRRIAIETGSLGDSLGVREPGAWACRVFAADWTASNAEWTPPSRDTLWWARWSESGDSLAMGVGTDGLPQRVRLWDDPGRSLEVRYPDWGWQSGQAWPERIEVVEGDRHWRVSCRIERFQFADRPDPRWLALSIPSGVERVDWSRLRRALERMREAR